MWNSRTKTDLIIEVWEALDCESVGAKEILAIEEAVRERFGADAVDMPMRTARLLADEGAELRHAEVMTLDSERRGFSPYEDLTGEPVKISDFEDALAAIRRFEEFRRRFAAAKDIKGLKVLNEVAVRAKKSVQAATPGKPANARRSAEAAEIASWLQIWIESPEIFENWITLRRASADFRDRFPEGEKPEKPVRDVF